jgi:hypothetical protein
LSDCGANVFDSLQVNGDLNSIPLISLNISPWNKALPIQAMNHEFVDNMDKAVAHCANQAGEVKSCYPKSLTPAHQGYL